MPEAMDGGTPPGSPGECPDCASPITGADVLIEYETGDGGYRTFAECPQCRDVVHPR